MLKDEELLASGELTKRIIVNSHAKSITEQVDIYRKERMLIYGCLMVKGQLQDQQGLVKTRSIHSPIFYFPAAITHNEEYSVSIDSHDLRLNSVLLRQLLKPDIDTTALDQFPIIEWPISKSDISKIEDWLTANTLISKTEELVRWPSFRCTEDRDTYSLLSVSTASCLVLADRAKGSRGILHELKKLLESTPLSSPLKALFSGQTNPKSNAHSQPELLPSILSAAQKAALNNAAQYTLSLISGPPGTGKSYTIAAIAMDRMLHGESVIVVTKSEQATNIIGHLLAEQFGLTTGYVSTNDQSFIKSIKAYLNSLLNEGIDNLSNVTECEMALNRSYNSLTSLQKHYEKLLWSYKHLHDSNAWYKKIIASIRIKYNGLSELWALKQEIEDTQSKIESRAIAFINAYRANSLNKVLLKHRQDIVQFQSSLRSRNSKTADERFAATNFNSVLKAFPIWLLNADDVNRVLPFSRELFDLVIIDEATQCDMASALPVMYRAKRACVVGDGKQLRHLSFLSKTKQATIKSKCFADTTLNKTISYREQSLLDIASDAIHSQAAVSMLNEHFRSKPELISFSNTHFYSSKLVLMQDRPNVSNANALQFVNVKGKRSSTGKNKIEKDAIISKIESLIAKYEKRSRKPSIGVMSPYREQSQYLQNAINRQFSAQQIDDFRIKTSTPFGFQGEERDIVLLSFGIDNQSARAATYLNREDMFNVLITRAKQQQIVFYSIDPQQLNPTHLLHKYLSFDYANEYQIKASDETCQFADEVKCFLEAQGADVWIDDTILGQQVDLLCAYENVVVAIDLIGFPGKFEAYSCISTYGVFKRAGVEILPIPYAKWVNAPQACKAKLKQLLFSHR